MCCDCFWLVFWAQSTVRGYIRAVCCIYVHWLWIPAGWANVMSLCGGSEGVMNFPGIFYAMQRWVPVWHFRNTSGYLFPWLVCGSFQWRHGLLFTDCIVWDDKVKVSGFKRSHSTHLGWWSTGSQKLQLFQLSQHSHLTNCRLISSSAYFPWNMILNYKMQLSKGSGDKILYSKSRTAFFWRKKYFFPVVCLSKRYIKVPKVIFMTSL